MVRRKGVRRHLTRNRSIALVIAIVAFGIVGIQGTDLGFDIILGKFYEGTEFSVTIFDNIVPLQFAQNFALSCQLWSEAELVFIDGTTRDLGKSENTFSETAFLSVIDPVTGKEVTRIDGEIRMRCQSPVSIDVLQITSGTVQHVITVTKVGATTERLNFSPQSLSQVDLLTSSSAGALLKSFSFNADLINNAIGTNEQEYTVRPTLITTVEAEVTAVAEGTGGGIISSSKTVLVGLGSWSNLAFTIQNDDFDPNFSPVGQPILITEHKNSIRGGTGFNLDDPILDLVLQVDLPNYDQAFESLPEWKINAASPQTGLPTGGILGTDTIDVKIGNTEFGEIICFTVTNCANKDKTVGVLNQGVYITTAFSTDRQTEDIALFVITDDQSGTIPIPVPPTPRPDPCLDATGSSLEECEIAKGELLSCDEPTYVKITKSLLDQIRIVPGIIVVVQPGSDDINDFTTHICLAQETIDLFESMGGGQCTDPNFIFDLQSPTNPFGTNTCICGVTLDADGTCGGVTVGPALADSFLLYDIVYTGFFNPDTMTSSDFGTISQSPEVAFTDLSDLLLSFVAEPSTGKLYPLARIHLVPVIDVSNIPSIQGNPEEPIFTFTWTASITRAGEGEDAKTSIGELERCEPPGFGVRTEASLISPSTSCDIFDMNSVYIIVDGDRLGLTVEEDIEQGQFYQIARSDIRFGQIEDAISQKGVSLNDGDKIELKLVVEGSFLLNNRKTVGIVQPMEWIHELTWSSTLGPEPCEGLTGQALEDCLAPPPPPGCQVTNTCPKSDCRSDESITECWERNHPIKGNGVEECRSVLVGLEVTEVCGIGGTTPPIGGSTKTTTGTTKGTSILDCPEGSTTQECFNLLLRVLEQQAISLLGLSPQTITTLSNNAVLLIGAVLVILVIAVIGRQIIIRRRRRF